MHRAGDSLGQAMDQEGFGDYPRPGELSGLPPGEIEAEDRDPDDAAMAKAELVLKVFADAGLQSTFDMHVPSAKALWAAQLGQFSTDALTAAAGEWVTRDGVAKFPPLGTFVALIRQIIHEDGEAERAKDHRACPDCDDLHYVKVIDDTYQQETFRSKQRHLTKTGEDDGVEENREYIEVQQYHMAPCPTCPGMEKRRELYDAGHWRPQHLERGGCPKCWEYTFPWKVPRRRGGHRGD